jgi:hypothetical protein
MPIILPMTKKRNKSKVKRYPTDLNEKKCAIITPPLLPDALLGGRPREVSLRKVINAIQKDDPRSRWLQSLSERRNKNIAAVALANKIARMEKRFEQVDKRFEQIEKRFEQVE